MYHGVSGSMYEKKREKEERETEFVFSRQDTLPFRGGKREREM